jgi:hypothetical protein
MRRPSRREAFHVATAYSTDAMPALKSSAAFTNEGGHAACGGAEQGSERRKWNPRRRRGRAVRPFLEAAGVISPL